MIEAIFVNRSVQFHKDMKYHAMDDDTNYKAKNLQSLIQLMVKEGALFDDPNDRFSLTFLENRSIIGVGVFINSGAFRVTMSDGTTRDYKVTS